MARSPHAGASPSPSSTPFLPGILCLGLLAGCAVESPPSSAPQRVVESAIQGGYPDDVDHAVVGLVGVAGGFSTCTGTLISANVILTARHCVASVQDEAPNGGVICGTTYFSPPKKASTYQYTTSQMIWSNASVFRPVAEIMIPSQEDTFCGYDVALIRLSNPLDASVATPRIPRIDEPLYVPSPGVPGAGEGYSAIGYGLSSEADKNSSGFRRRRDNLYALCGEGNCGPWASQSMTDTEWRGDTGVCSGDSGGPAIDLQGRVIGVASRGGPECSSPIYVSVYAWRDWIKSEVVSAAAKAGIAAPAWTTGWPTLPELNHPIGAECDADDQCPSGVCMLGQYCTRKCTDEAPCGSNFFCNIADYCMLREVGETCAEDTDCGSGRCHSGHCTRGCSDGVWACPSGWTCAENSDICELQPVGVSCVTDDKCEGGSCLHGLCTRNCSDTASCPGGWSCDAGQCALLPVGDECEGDADCGPDGRCDKVSGRCTRSCSTTAPCPTHWECGTSGECALPDTGGQCSGDSDCVQGASCGADELCTRGCDALAPCPGELICGGDGMCAAVIPDIPPPAAAIAGGCDAAPNPSLLGVFLGLLAVLFGRRRRRRLGSDV